MLKRIIAMLTSFLTAGSYSTSPQVSLPSNQPGSFALTEVESKETPEGTLKTWRATSRNSDRQPFVFRLEMLLKTPKGNVPMAFSKGAIIRECGGDGRQFLHDVALAIKSDTDPATEAAKVDRLDFSTAILGTSLSRESEKNVIGGSFSSSKPGNWIAFKLFLADGEGEVYLNIDPVVNFKAHERGRLFRVEWISRENRIRISFDQTIPALGRR